MKISSYPIVNAIRKLDPNAEFEYHPEKDTIKILKSDEDITEEQIREEASKIKYKSDRINKYPSIGDQLDALYHAGVFPTDMAAKIKKVKDDNPKS